MSEEKKSLVPITRRIIRNLPTFQVPPLPALPPSPAIPPPLPLSRPPPLERRVQQEPTFIGIESIPIRPFIADPRPDIVRTTFPYSYERAANAGNLINYIYNINLPIDLSEESYNENMKKIQDLQVIIGRANAVLRPNIVLPRVLYAYVNYGIDRHDPYLYNSLLNIVKLLRERLDANNIEYKHERLGSTKSIIDNIDILEEGLKLLNDNLYYDFYVYGIIRGVQQYILIPGELVPRKEGLIHGNFHSYGELFNNGIINLRNESDLLFTMFKNAVKPNVRGLSLPYREYMQDHPTATRDEVIANLTDEQKIISVTVHATLLIDNQKTDRLWPLNDDGFERLKDFVDNPNRVSTSFVDTKTWNFSEVEMIELKFDEYTNWPTGWTPRLSNTIAFFPKLSLFILDLTYIQILREQDIQDFDGEQCFINALRKSDIEEYKLQEIMEAFPEGAHFKCLDLEKVATDILKRSITVWHYDKNDERRKKTYGKRFGLSNTIKLSKEDDHIFVEKEYLLCTRYFINNYESLKNNPRGPLMSRLGRFDNPTYYTTGQLVHQLNKAGLFIESPLMNEAKGGEYLKSDEIILTKNNVESNQQLYEYDAKEGDGKEKEHNKGPFSVWASDYESDTTGNHRPLLSGLIRLDKPNLNIDDVYIYNTGNELDPDVINKRKSRKNVVTNLLNRVVNNSKSDGKKWAIVYYHNLKYDIELMLEDIDIRSDLNDKGRLFYVGIMHLGMYIELRDFVKIVSEPLHKFAKMFDLAEDMHKKEAIAYNYYKLNNRPSQYNNDSLTGVITKFNYVDVELYGKYLRDDKERSILKKNLRSNPTLFKYDGTKFDPWAYYEYYLRYDCLVLGLGIITLRNELEILDLDLFNFYTIGSLSIEYAKKNGAFDGVYQVKGILRKFIHKGINGGRNHVNAYYQKRLIDHNVTDTNGNKFYKDSSSFEGITDLDGVSLYPSAMKRIARESGFPLGKAKLIEGEFKPNEYDDYVVEIVIDDVCKYQDMPMICVRSDKTSLQYTNDVPEDTIVVDKITLEDYINFHHITYRFIQGVYWNEGFNKNIGENVIHKLFNMRLDAGAKYEKDPITGKKLKLIKPANEAKRQLYKMIMNSIYGKTIPKLRRTSSKVIPKIKWIWDSKLGRTVKDEHFWNKFLYNNYYSISDFQPINNTAYSVTQYVFDNSFDFAHIGAKILSMSRRIMNEVFDVANDNNTPIFYTDTDSIHILKSQLPLLEKKFKERYNKDLCGEELEQFHVDFKIEGSGLSADKIVSMQSVFVDKKIYLDMLVGYDGYNIYHDVHKRCKGIKEQALYDKVEEDYDNDWVAMYLFMATKKEGEYINFDMTSKGKHPYFKNKLYEYVRTDKPSFRSI